MNQSPSVLDTQVELILRDLFMVLPVLHKRLLRMGLGDLSNGLPWRHMAVMGMLRSGNQTASEMARMMAMPKSQMTAVITHLVNDGLVVRRADPNDRRVVNLELTGPGKTMLEERRHKIEERMRESLARLDQPDLERLSAALDTLQEVVTRL